MANPMAAIARPMSSLAKGISHRLSPPLAATLAVTEAREEPETAARVDPGEVVRVTVTGAPFRVSVWMMTTGWTMIGCEESPPVSGSWRSPPFPVSVPVPVSGLGLGGSTGPLVCSAHFPWELQKFEFYDEELLSVHRKGVPDSIETRH
jgi:hypothetical protein